MWGVNALVPETFTTIHSKGKIKLHTDEPAVGWLTEEYEKARILRPQNEQAGDMVIIVAEDPELYTVWDAVYADIMMNRKEQEH